jgi:DNA-binding GntR family transcriptional regulator
MRGEDEGRVMSTVRKLSSKHDQGRSGQLVSEIAELIKSRILKGLIAPGERVRDSVIAAEKGVSRAPVREALRLLENSGIVSKSPNHSYVVVRFGERDIHELATLRAALEALAARLAFGRAELIPSMRAVLPQMRAAVKADDYEAAMHVDREFHEALVRSADHGRLAEAYASLSDQIEMAYVSYYRRRPDISQLVDNHEELIEIARRGTVNDFVAALTDHIQTGLRIVRNAL